jgi:hypothetical protein
VWSIRGAIPIGSTTLAPARSTSSTTPAHVRIVKVIHLALLVLGIGLLAIALVVRAS